ncbi:MAG: pyridoxal phosphate-dependent decarboxylase family protein [Acidobacteriota bacterium]
MTDRRTGWPYQVFEQMASTLARRLSGYVRDSAAGAGPVVRIRPVSEIAADLDLGRWIRDGGMTPEAFDSFADTYCANSTRLHHPAYLAHQVAVPDFPSALADLMNGVMNNGMAIYEMGPAAVAVELAVLDWMLGQVGWLPVAGGDDGRVATGGAGVLTHGGSLANLTALLAARASAAPRAWEAGVPGDLGILVPPASHYSIARAASILGLGSEAMVPLAVDTRDVIRPDALPQALRRLTAAGRRPMALVANACATATGLFDPLDEIASFCAEAGIWMHVDGAHGATALLSPCQRERLRGVARADSMVWDAHKMLRTSALCAAVLFRDARAFEATFREKASYLFYGEPGQGVDLIHRTVECTKLPLGLKLFFNLAWRGERGLGEYWDDRLAAARRFAAIIADRPGFSCPFEPEANIVCFRHGTDDDHQIAVREALLASGRFHLSSAEIGGRRYLRLVVMSPATNDETIGELLDAIEALERTH